MKSQMTAAVLHAPGDLRIEQVPVPVLREDEALIRVKAVGICGSDPDRIMRKGTYSFPLIPGHEFSGMVEQAATSDSEWSRGDRVVVSPLIPCYQCDSCRSGHYGQCDSYSYLGSRTDGAFAEFVKAPIQNLVALPEEVSFAQGAVVEPAAVVNHGVRRVGIKSGDSVVVMGCGTLGLLALQFARIEGASVVLAADIDEEKLELARRLGADDAVDASRVDPVETIRKLTGGKGPKVAVETAGVAETQEQCLRVVQKQGRVLYLGTAHREVVLPAETFEKILRSELTLFGSWNSFSAPFPGEEWRSTVDHIARGELNVQALITHSLPLTEAPRVFEDLSRGGARAGLGWAAEPRPPEPRRPLAKGGSPTVKILFEL
jgi:L-iditol 2-dehydrogenase